MPTLKHVQPGEPLDRSASTWNAIIDSTKAFFAGRADRTGPVNLAGVAPSSGVVLVQNSTGGDLPIHGVMGIDDFAIDPTTQPANQAAHPVLDGVSPTASYVGKFAVAIEPIPDGAVGRCVVSGVVLAKVDMTAEAVERCDVEAGEASNLIETAAGGASILWREGSTGVQYALIHIDAAGFTVEHILARITGSTGASHTWVEAEWTSSTATGDKSGGRSGSAVEVNGREKVATNTIVTIQSMQATNGVVAYSFDIGSGDRTNSAEVIADGSGSLDTTEWSVDDQASDKRGMTVTNATRIENGGGDGDLPELVSREITTDANGNVIAVSQETGAEFGTTQLVVTGMTFDAGTVSFSDVYANINGQSAGPGGSFDISDLGGFDTINGDAVWIDVATDGTTATVSHINVASGASVDPTVDAEYDGTAHAIKITPVLPEVDTNGHVTGWSVATGDDIISIAMVSVTVVTDVQYDSENRVFQKKTRTIYVPEAGAESAWTTWLTAGTDECGSVEVSDTDCGYLVYRCTDNHLMGAVTTAEHTSLGQDYYLKDGVCYHIDTSVLVYEPDYDDVSLATATAKTSCTDTGCQVVYEITDCETSTSQGVATSSDLSTNSIDPGDVIKIGTTCYEVSDTPAVGTSTTFAGNLATASVIAGGCEDDQCQPYWPVYDCDTDTLQGYITDSEKTTVGTAFKISTTCYYTGTSGTTSTPDFDITGWAAVDDCDDTDCSGPTPPGVDCVNCATDLVLTLAGGCSGGACGCAKGKECADYNGTYDLDNGLGSCAWIATTGGQNIQIADSGGNWQIQSYSPGGCVDYVGGDTSTVCPEDSSWAKSTGCTFTTVTVTAAP